MQIKKQTLVGIVISIILSSSFLIVLLITSFDFTKQPKGTFFRQFAKHVATQRVTIDLGVNSYYLAGGTDHHIYLGNVTSPLRMMAINTISADTQKIKVKIETIKKYNLSSVRVSVDSPYFYVMDGTTPVLFRGEVGDWRGKRFMYDSAHFTDATPIGPWSFAIRTVKRAFGEYVLAKIKVAPPNLEANFDLLEKQVDGRFCVDGRMHYNKAIHKLIYVYAYRNQFIVADTNLNLNYRGNTIDTVSRARIKVDTIKSQNAITLSEPPLLVNKKSCVSGDWLFINSNLPAKNEINSLNAVSVIDVYDLKNGKYKLSFYIDSHEGYKMRDFHVIGTQLVVLTDHYLMIYDLSSRYFKDKPAL